MHVPLRHAQFAVPGELLDRLRRRATHREVRAERVTQQVNAPSYVRPARRAFDPVLDLLPRQGSLSS